MSRRRTIAEQRRRLAERGDVQRELLTRLVDEIDAIDVIAEDLAELGRVEHRLHLQPLRDLADEARLFTGEACVGCGCTLSSPCEGGCELDLAGGVCSACSGVAPHLVLIRGARAEA